MPTRSNSAPEIKRVARARRRGWTTVARVLIVGIGLAALGGCGSAGASASKPVTLRVARSVGFGVGISDIATAPGALWITADAAVLRADPRTGLRVARIAVPGTPFPIAAGPSAVWVGVLAPDESQGMLVRIDPVTNRIAATIDLGEGDPMGIAVSPQTVWVDTDLNGGTVYRVNPQTNSVSGSIIVAQAADLALGGGSLWVAQQFEDSVDRINTTTNSVIGSPVKFAGEKVGGLVYADGSVWAGEDAQDLFKSGSVVSFDPASNSRGSITIANQQAIGVLVSAFGRVWVLTVGNAIELGEIDPETHALNGSSVRVNGSPNLESNVVAGDGALWVITDGKTLTELVPA